MGRLSAENERAYARYLQERDGWQQARLRDDLADPMRRRDAIFETSTTNLIERQRDLVAHSLRCIPSEAFKLPDVRDAEQMFGAAGRDGAYDEGTPRAKYYRGTANAAQAELEAQQAVKDLLAEIAPGNDFAVDVQPLSGANANLGVYAGLLEPGDPVMGLDLSNGGHLSHFSKVSLTGRAFDPRYFEIEKQGGFDYEALERQIMEHHPRLLIVGGSAIPKEIDFARFAEICHRHNCLVVADISHTAGHVLTGNLSNAPLKTADVVTFTLQKMGGSKAAISLARTGVKAKNYVNPKRLAGEAKPDETMVADLVRKGLFPGVQGGPDSTKYLGIKTLFEALQTGVMRGWSRRVLRSIQNVQATLLERGVQLTSESDTHLILVDTEASVGTPGGKTQAGYRLAVALEEAGIIVNANGIKGDPNLPWKPGGTRIGVNGPARQTHWGVEQDRWLGKSIADLIAVLNDSTKLPTEVARIRGEVDEVLKHHPVRWDIDYTEQDGPFEAAAA